MAIELWGTDTETTGADLRHGCKPFFVSSCSQDGDRVFWEWDVDPMTREPIVPRRDKVQVARHLSRHRHVFHNSKFDVRALEMVGIRGVDWDLLHDTHIASHVLASGESHGLKELAMMYLDIPDDDQKELQECVNAARRIGRKLGWRIAKQFDPHFPALKSPKKVGWWVMDMWLPRAVAKHYEYEDSHPWWTVCYDYAMLDAERTIALWQVMREELDGEALFHLYDKRRRLLPVTYKMEDRGISYNKESLKEAKTDFGLGAEKSEGMCYQYAEGHLRSIKSTDQLRSTLFGKFKFNPKTQTDLSPKIYLTDTGQFSTNKDVLNALQLVAHPREKRFQFIKHLQFYRKYTKALEYLEGYERAGMRVRGRKGGWLKNWRMLFPNFNIAGTATTRFASYDPNAQNISKQELINLRRIFGPLPGREWWGIDYENIEMRIFAYCSGDKNLIAAFEQGYSVHLIIAEILFPKEFKACQKAGEDFKTRYKSTLYQWVKNGNFSLIYGAGKAKANATYRREGAYETIRKKLPLIDEFMCGKQQEAKDNGYIEILGGYRLQVPTSEPHKAVNYFVQGTAGWCMVLAMLRVDEYLATLPDYHITMTIHDELDFDFPKHRRNVGVIQEVARLMEQSGDDIGLPTPVDVERHPDTWHKGEALAGILASAI